MQQIRPEELETVLDFPALIEALREAFCRNVSVPARHHYDYRGNAMPSTLLLMPAWEEGAFLGVKIITVSPENNAHNRPAVQGCYLLFDIRYGTPLAQIDAPILTALRTAATSALASEYLSRSDSRSLLMAGTGALAPYLIQAHATVRPLRRVFIWGRRYQRAEDLAARLQPTTSLHLEPVHTIEEVIREADIISCATLSATPLIAGELLRPGQHLDLVGSFKPDMREADDEAVRRSSIFVDTRDGAPRESGDIAIPIQHRILTVGAIKADLFDLCRGHHGGRHNEEEITFFKSVGHALEDLAAAQLAYRRLNG